MSKKVCILTSVHPKEDTRIFIKQALSLKNAGYNVILIAQNNKKEVKEGIKIIPLTEPKNRFERIFKLNWKLYKKALKVDADIYHFHDPELIFIGLLLKLKGKKVIYDVHEDVPEQILSKSWIWKPIRKLISIFMKKTEKLADKYLDGIVSATPNIDDKFNNKNSIIVQNFPLLDELTSSKLKFDKEENIVTYVGGISEARGIKKMIEAISLIPDKYESKFILAGSFSSKKLKKEVVNLNGWNKVEFQGWVKRKKIKEDFLRSKAGLVVLQPLDRYKVSFPIKMFEYMSAGLPVVASNFSLWKEIIIENNCGIVVNPENPKEIAGAIKYIFDNSQKAKIMGENARKAVEEKYNWKNEEEKLIKIYRKILDD